MVLLPGCTCCPSLCTICPDWCSYSLQVLAPEVAASGLFFGSSVNPSCRPTSSPALTKTYGICPDGSYTNASHVHDICRFNTCDTDCSVGNLGLSIIESQYRTLSRLSVGEASFGSVTDDGLYFGVGVNIGVQSFGFANCGTENLEARWNGASSTVGIKCRYISSLPSAQLEIYADYVAFTQIIRKAGSGSPITYQYFRRTQKSGAYVLDRMCGREQLDRRCDYLADDAVRILPPDGFFPLDFSLSSDGTTLGGWQYESNETPASSSDPSYSIGEENFSCLLSTFATTVRMNRRQCRDVNPLP